MRTCFVISSFLYRECLCGQAETYQALQPNYLQNIRSQTRKSPLVKPVRDVMKIGKCGCFSQDKSEKFPMRSNKKTPIRLLIRVPNSEKLPLQTVDCALPVVSSKLVTGGRCPQCPVTRPLNSKAKSVHPKTYTNIRGTLRMPNWLAAEGKPMI